ncbi:hypothetical protein F4824DRAFT_504620 [Ustulina deusta]|nr:hypothetical protein F4824DRAFT_504620 [Ustulina deusta]
MSEYLREIERLQHELEQAEARDGTAQARGPRDHAGRVFTQLPPSHFQSSPNCRHVRVLHWTCHEKDVCPDPVVTGEDIDTFEKVAIESPTFNFTELRFSNNSRELKRQGEIGQTGDSERSHEIQSRRRRSRPSKRAVSKQKVQQPSYPDGLGLRKHLGGGETLAFVYDYKAAHKLRVKDLKPALVTILLAGMDERLLDHPRLEIFVTMLLSFYHLFNTQIQFSLRNTLP